MGLVHSGLHCRATSNCTVYGLLMRIKVTNKLNLPQAFVEAIQNDPYDPDDGGQHSDYTITGLLSPPRASQLERTNEVVEDAGDLLFSLQGQIMHGILERAKPILKAKGFIVEERFYKQYEVGGKSFTISAKIDVFDPANGRLSDYKYTTVGSATRGLKDEHKWQVNFQALLVREAGHSVQKADATILMRDWSAERNYESYPKSPCMVHNVPLLSVQEVDAFIVERIRLHEAAKVSLPLCSDNDRWQRNTYAVMKDEKAAKAVAGGVKDTLQEAEELLKKYPNGVIQDRPGQSIRCLRYCPVRTICEQAKQYRKVLEPEVDEDGFTKVG